MPNGPSYAVCEPQQCETPSKFFFIVDAYIAPILGRNFCIGMRILDSDKVDDQSDVPAIAAQNQVLSQYADIFNGLR